MKRIVVIVTMLLVSLSAVSAFAGSSQSTFSISPPPIATPVFGVKETDIKVGATYLSMKSSDTRTTDFKLDGYGIDFVGRSAFGSVVAIDYAIGVMYLTGDIKSSSTGTFKSDLSGVNIPISFNLEIQPYKNDVFNIILFVGPAFNISAMSVKSTILGTTDTTDVTSYLYGPEGGVQMGFELGSIHLDVFGMATSLQGTQDISSSSGFSSTETISAYTTTSYGADLMYTPWGLTLSSIMQEAKQSDQKGFKTSIYTLSWSHKF